MSNFRFFTVAEITFLQSQILNNIMRGFKESINATMDWWLTDECREFYQERQYRISIMEHTEGQLSL